MNIKDKGFWPEGEVVPPPTPETFAGLLKLRYATAVGFCEVEREKGLIQLGTSLGSSKGQEMLRNLFFRVIEEFAEAIASDEEDHMKEELIDCLNYLLEARMIEVVSPDDPIFSIEGLPRILYTSWLTINGYTKDYFCIPTIYDLGELSYTLGTVGDALRNRAWMNHPQDIYFIGRPLLDSAVIKCLLILFQYFEDFEDFWSFYIAKDRVLQFRIRSKY